MKAVVKYGQGEGKVELREMPSRSPKSKEIKIEVKACGICGSGRR